MANEGKGLRGLPGLNNISAEERQQFMLANEDKLRKYSRARDREKAAEIIYNNRQFINEFGEEAFEQYFNTLVDLTSNSLDTWFIPDNFIMGAGVTLGVKTMFGPIELQLSKSNVMKDWTLFVNFGYWF